MTLDQEEEEEKKKSEERGQYLERLLDNILVYDNNINKDNRKVDEDDIPYLQSQDFPFVANYLLNKALVKCSTSNNINPLHHHTDRRKESGGKEAEKGRREGKGKEKVVPLLGQEEVLLESNINDGDKFYRISEIEFYLYNKDHPDAYTHLHEDQCHFGKWYFHRAGGKGYREGTFKGVDLSLGNENQKSYCGVLIRSLYDILGNRMIEGPCNCVNELIGNIGYSKVRDFMEERKSPLSCALPRSEVMTEQGLQKRKKRYLYNDISESIEKDSHQEVSKKQKGQSNNKTPKVINLKTKQQFLSQHSSDKKSFYLVNYSYLHRRNQNQILSNCQKEEMYTSERIGLNETKYPEYRWRRYRYLIKKDLIRKGKRNLVSVSSSLEG